VVADVKQPAVLKDRCLEVLRRVPSAIAIVTLRVEGRPWGVTVSSFSPVTMDPPKVMVSLFKDTMAARYILQNATFGVSLLSAQQRLIAEVSARPGTPKFMESFCREADLFEMDAYGVSTNVSSAPGDHHESSLMPPRVAGADHLDCELAHSFQVDDHVLLVGRVNAVTAMAAGRDPLIYVNRSFATVSAP
jgi:flavin reductase (DIM6/NTAB) family NADH-FMN oxidoreductase RutF